MALTSLLFKEGSSASTIHKLLSGRSMVESAWRLSVSQLLVTEVTGRSSSLSPVWRDSQPLFANKITSLSNLPIHHKSSYYFTQFLACLICFTQFNSLLNLSFTRGQNRYVPLGKVNIWQVSLKGAWSKLFTMSVLSICQQLHSFVTHIPCKYASLTWHTEESSFLIS